MKSGAAKTLGRAAVCAAAAFACAPAWLILRYGVDVPYSDQWNIAPFFEKYARVDGRAVHRLLLQQQLHQSLQLRVMGPEQAGGPFLGFP